MYTAEITLQKPFILINVLYKTGFGLSKMYNKYIHIYKQYILTNPAQTLTWLDKIKVMKKQDKTKDSERRNMNYKRRVKDT